MGHRVVDKFILFEPNRACAGSAMIDMTKVVSVIDMGGGYVKIWLANGSEIDVCDIYADVVNTILDFTKNSDSKTKIT